MKHHEVTQQLNMKSKLHNNLNNVVSTVKAVYQVFHTLSLLLWSILKKCQIVYSFLSSSSIGECFIKFKAS